MAKPRFKKDSMVDIVMVKIDEMLRDPEKGPSVISSYIEKYPPILVDGKKNWGVSYYRLIYDSLYATTFGTCIYEPEDLLKEPMEMNGAMAWILTLPLESVHWLTAKKGELEDMAAAMVESGEMHPREAAMWNLTRLHKLMMQVAKYWKHWDWLRWLDERWILSRWLEWREYDGAKIMIALMANRSNTVEMRAVNLESLVYGAEVDPKPITDFLTWNEGEGRDFSEGGNEVMAKIEGEEEALESKIEIANLMREYSTEFDYTKGDEGALPAEENPDEEMDAGGLSLENVLGVESGISIANRAKMDSYTGNVKDRVMDNKYVREVNARVKTLNDKRSLNDLTEEEKEELRQLSEYYRNYAFHDGKPILFKGTEDTLYSKLAMNVQRVMEHRPDDEVSKAIIKKRFKYLEGQFYWRCTVKRPQSGGVALLKRNSQSYSTPRKKKSAPSKPIQEQKHLHFKILT